MFEIIIASLSVASLSLIGVFFFGRRGHLAGTTRYIIPLAIGVFLGVIFFELVPETIEAGGEMGSLAIATGFIAFYLLSHLLHTYHHHHDNRQGDSCEDKVGASMLLWGDAVHNLADGVVIATAFLIDPAVGIATTIGVALHEIPQEIAEFGVLVKAGYSKAQAAFLNFLSASSILVGALATIILASQFADYIWILTGLAAGNLLYIVASDLLPDEHEESRESGRVLESLITTLIGLILIISLLHWSHENFKHHEHDHEEEGHEHFADTDH